jgi:hypothetical protein
MIFNYPGQKFSWKRRPLGHATAAALRKFMKSREPGWKLDEPNSRPRGESKVVTWASLTAKLLKNGCAGMSLK